MKFQTEREAEAYEYGKRIGKQVAGGACSIFGMFVCIGTLCLGIWFGNQIGYGGGQADALRGKFHYRITTNVVEKVERVEK
jgi:hypothetical protein